jgi:ribonuclease HI
VIVACDGAARGNPGPAGAGVQITDEHGVVVAEIAEPLGETTNNGLERAEELGATRVLLRSDSQLLINQLTGRYRVRTPHLQPLHRRVLELAARFESIEYEHVRRELNTEADRLANEGVDDLLSGRRPSRRLD